MFYVHARLLERAAKLSKEKGGGSLTALPIAETDAGNLSAYIPTNLISITDGQIVLDAKLFHEGQKPAVDVGTSVSRVGGKTQAHALREAAETLRLDYAQFLELEMFTRFGGMPDARVRDQLTRGARIRAILDQPQHAPLRLADEVALVLAVQSGLLDPLPLPAVVEFRRGLRDALDRGAAGRRPPRSRTPARSTTRGSRRFARRSHTLRRDRRASTAPPSGEPAMTERLADISARIDGIRQLGAVVNAMRGIAAARAQQARGQLVAVDSYAATIAVAIGRALALDPFRSARRRAQIGPAGARAVLRRAGIRRRLQRTRARRGRRRSRDIRAVPHRHARRAVAAERGIGAGWKSAMPSHSLGIPKLADRIAEALYARIATGEIDRLDAVFSQWQPSHGTHIERRRLFPLDLAAFPRPRRRRAAPEPGAETLLSELTADYMHAQLCNAALHAFAAENEARMEAMARTTLGS